MPSKLILFLFIFVSQTVQSQSLYWIYLNTSEKDTTILFPISTIAQQNRISQNLKPIQHSDFPPSTKCLRQIAQTGIRIRVISKWLNAVSASLNTQQIEELKQCNCVSEIIPLSISTIPAGDFTIQQDIALQQMKGEILNSKEMNGSGFTIGVIDAGFFGADTSFTLQTIFKNKRILEKRDFLTTDVNKNFYSAETFLDFHGTYVLNCIAGKINDYQYGFSTESNFILARTDHGINESRREEDLWIAAVEWMDSLGVKLINSSLGYCTEFDNAAEDYKPNQINGTYSAIARAANIASQEKGILLVISAGNEGANKKWEILSTPADAQGVLSVGANSLNGLKQNYSSIGPEKLPWLKPEVSAYSEEGTSFSAPLITGLAAVLWSEYPTLTNLELKDIICKSAHLYPFGNNYLGYGIPQANRAIQLLENDNKSPKIITRIKAEKKKVIIPIDNANTSVTLFHTKGEQWVVKQESINPTGKSITIPRPAGCTHTTVVINLKDPIQIQWK